MIISILLKSVAVRFCMDNITVGGLFDEGYQLKYKSFELLDLNRD